MVKNITMENTTFDFLKKLLELDIVQNEGRRIDEEELTTAYEKFHRTFKKKGVGGWK